MYVGNNNVGSEGIGNVCLGTSWSVIMYVGNNNVGSEGIGNVCLGTIGV